MPQFGRAHIVGFWSSGQGREQAAAGKPTQVTCGLGDPGPCVRPTSGRCSDRVLAIATAADKARVTLAGLDEAKKRSTAKALQLLEASDSFLQQAGEMLTWAINRDAPKEQVVSKLQSLFCYSEPQDDTTVHFTQLMIWKMSMELQTMVAEAEVQVALEKFQQELTVGRMDRRRELLGTLTAIRMPNLNNAVLGRQDGQYVCGYVPSMEQAGQQKLTWDFDQGVIMVLQCLEQLISPVFRKGAWLHAKMEAGPENQGA